MSRPSICSISTASIPRYRWKRWWALWPIWLKRVKFAISVCQEVSAQTLRRACKVHPIAAVQTEYSLWSREPEAGILHTCRELGVGFVPYSPLGRGFLTGTITDPGVLAADDFRRHLPRFQAETMRKNQLLLERLQQVATRYDATLAQIALARVMSKGEDIVPIPGARKIAHLRDNAGAANITLAAEDILTIEHIFTADNVTGLRYTRATLI